MYLFEVWYWQQLLQSGEELADQSLQCCIKVRAILHRKHILPEGRTLLRMTVFYPEDRCLNY